MVEFLAGQIGGENINYSLIIALDIGFSKNRKTCGLVIELNGEIEYADNCKFSEVVKKTTEYIQEHDDVDVCLIIEAPLSVAMKDGNPVGRCFEKKDEKTRYWYVGAGAAVALAAVRFINELKNCESKARIHLFEGFLSFKDKDITHEEGDDNKDGEGHEGGKERKGHKEDAKELVRLFKAKNGSFCDPDALDGGCILNIFKFLGCGDILGTNIPAVILNNTSQECDKCRE